MSDHMAARIQIGGKIAQSLVSPLCEVIADAGVSLEFGGGSFRPGSPEELLEARQDGEGALLLELCDDQARWGTFNDLEDFLREHGIAYTRQSEGKYEYDPEVAEFRPEEGLFMVLTDTTFRPIVPAGEVQSAVEALVAAIELLQGGSIGSAISSLQATRQSLQDRLPTDLPPLQSFEIEKGVES